MPMRVFQIQDDWGFDHLQLATRPQPTPGPGQVLLKMKAASLNYRDLVVPMRGYGSFTGELPLIPVSDGVGEVVEVGSGVTRVKVGDRVCPCFNQGWIAGEPDLERMTQTLGGPLDGTMADYMCLSEQGVVKAPEHLTDEEAATLPCAALTAWSAIVTYERLGPGSRVLVQGTGGVALFALQFAKLLGAHVTVISSSDDKLARAKALGADAGINYRTTPEWYKPARALTGGRGFDHIVELGGEKTLPQSLRAARPCGDAPGAAAGHHGRPSRRLRGDGARDRAAPAAAGDRPRVPLRGAERSARVPEERRALRQDLHSALRPDHGRIGAAAIGRSVPRRDGPTAYTRSRGRDAARARCR
jgi:NADPH:quinone reductase-like Zn-dependent oxidoreductase